MISAGLRPPSQISFHESFRFDGEDYYSIVDLPIRVTNSIPEDTELAGSQVRPRCDLRNNPLIPFEDRNAAIRVPSSQPYLGDSSNGSGGGGGSDTSNDSASSGNDVNNDSNDDTNTDSGNGNDSNDNDGVGGGNGGVLDPGRPGAGTLQPDSFEEGVAASVQLLSPLCLLSLVGCTILLSW